jgi:putative colanic acid biosynthesis glycosyltransferase WcaI
LSAKGQRPRVLVLNQYYRPGFEATAQLLGDLCSELAHEFSITVVTGALSVPGGQEGSVDENGVRVVRVRSTTFDRAGLARRGANYVTYLALAFKEALRSGKPDVVLCMTDPPVVADVALAVARRFRVPLVVISQDIFPEIAVRLGRLENRPLVGLLRTLIGFYLRRADRVVAIGETMRHRLIEKATPADRIVVIPNWVDVDAITPSPKNNEWSREHGLAERFVVMHSGNIGHAQNLDSLVRAGTFLRDLDDLTIAIIGGGARHDELLEMSELLEVDAVRFFGYQPRASLSLSLSAGDVHVVGLAPGLAGFVVPSRLYGILAAGRPVIVGAERESETAQLVEEVGCGVVVPPARPELLAAAIRAAYDGELDLVEMGQRGREYAVREAGRAVAIDRYRNMLHELVRN